MLGTSWECHKVREFALRPMGDFLPVLDHIFYVVVNYDYTPTLDVNNPQRSHVSLS